MQKGFSMIEILVTVAVIAILSTIGIQTYFAAKSSAQLDADIITITNAIRAAQNKALSPSKTGLPNTNNRKICAYGISFTASTFRNYYRYLGTTGQCNQEQLYGNTIRLSQTQVQNPLPLLGDIEFTIPFGAKANNNPTTINLNLKSDTSVIKSITVTKTGLIQVQ
jgi:prepilin-type N-terminal cleavage/methylation domain-containing protein